MKANPVTEIQALDSMLHRCFVESREFRLSVTNYKGEGKRWSLLIGPRRSAAASGKTLAETTANWDAQFGPQPPKAKATWDAPALYTLALKVAGKGVHLDVRGIFDGSERLAFTATVGGHSGRANSPEKALAGAVKRYAETTLKWSGKQWDAA